MAQKLSSLSIRSQRVLTSSNRRIAPATISIENGKVAGIDYLGRRSSAKPTLDFGDYLVIPGIVDSHAHINEPGRTDWEGFRTATRAALAGGITTVIDMPLNCIPATTSMASLEAKKSAARSAGLACNIGFWGGVIPGNQHELEPMIKQGVCGFKAFLIDSGVREFPNVELSDLKIAMPILAKHNIPLLVHAELESPVEQETIEDYRDFVRTRPDKWEVDAIATMVQLCRETRCPVHIVHLSSSKAIDLIRKAKLEGLPISVETCPHYLTLNAERIGEDATYFKCAPPIRGLENQNELWKGLIAGTIDAVVSDHSPCTPQLKDAALKDAWGGISGLQLSLPIVWTKAQERFLPEQSIVRWMCEFPAQLAGLSGQKGSLEIGYDADFIVLDTNVDYKVIEDEILHRHKKTPYNGTRLCARVEKAFLHGKLAFSRDQVEAVENLGDFVNRKTIASPADTDEINLLSESLGASVLEATDDFFAEKENLIRDTPPIFIPEKFTDRGKWMDGWESRRKRDEGHDSCVLKMGSPGKVTSLEIDTAHFTGNFPEQASVEAAFELNQDLSAKKLKWKEILTRTNLSGGQNHSFQLEVPTDCTHLRLNIFPDGGVARFRAFGEVIQPRFKSDQLVDFANVLNGGRAVECNDMFFSSKDNINLPLPAPNMGQGWETKRKRAGDWNKLRQEFDWIVLRLGSPCTIKKIEIDTKHFKGNFPESCLLEAAIDAPKSDDDWTEVLGRSHLSADQNHSFEILNQDQKYQYVRLKIFPDGGVSRLRVWGLP